MMLLGGLATVHSDMDKKIFCTVGYGKMLCEHPAMMQQQDVWGKTLKVSNPHRETGSRRQQ
eukprot:3187508-Pyramimonas_sp.AAC.1